MTKLNWLELFEHPFDLGVFGAFVLVFPVYHALYPWLSRRMPNRATKTRVDRLRTSWIQGLVERRDLLLAAQQTRNLTMVNTVLASSALILMGFTANLLIGTPDPGAALTGGIAGGTPGAQAAKLVLLIAVFGFAFAYCMTALRHLGHFVLVVGADPKLLAEGERSATDYLSGLINRASNRYTLAVRCFYSASPLFLWLFDSRLALALTLMWGFKFVAFQDFRRTS